MQKAYLLLDLAYSEEIREHLRGRNYLIVLIRGVNEILQKFGNIFNGKSESFTTITLGKHVIFQTLIQPLLIFGKSANVAIFCLHKELGTGAIEIILMGTDVGKVYDLNLHFCG